MGKSLWTKICRRRSAEKCLRAKFCGQKSVGKGLWTKVCAQRSVDKGLWTKVCEQRSVDKGVWTKVCGQRSVDKGLWAKAASLAAVGAVPPQNCVSQRFWGKHKAFWMPTIRTTTVKLNLSSFRADCGAPLASKN